MTFRHRAGVRPIRRLAAGSDLEEYSPELTANVEKKSNIVGETTVTINGYQKQGEVSPYYAEPGDRCLSVCRPSSTVIWCWMT